MNGGGRTWQEPMRQKTGQPLSFMFATGIENSIPTIKNGTVRIDQMEKCGHYDRWREDFDLVEDLAISVLRYGPPLHRTYRGPGRYDWEFADQAFEDLRQRNITPIVDLCHFGVPDWIGNFQNPDFPELFAAYARAFAKRFNWVQLYTPINEMYICALFSARYGWWNEQLSTDRSFVTALKHIVRANVRAMQEIVAVRPEAIFIQSESTEYYHPDNPKAIKVADFKNAERFLSLDLNYGHRVDSEVYEYLMDNGLTRDEYHFFLQTKLKQRCILGNDYYATNEHRVAADGSSRSAGDVFGYADLTREYFKRYGIPVMHTETNLAQGPTGKEASDWLWKQWANILRVRQDSIPIVGFTWYSLTDQVDWDTALREENNRVHPVGLYDLDRNVRPVGRAFKKLVRDWKVVLPTDSICLQVPVIMPDEQGSGWARRIRRESEILNEAAE